ncbi:BAG family molecular chaperone regulator 6 [Pyrus communis]|uniref:BAG family molecular chaperone regulator 6 n=1 Tax=Pyrus communis TaxID=23211 RepID=UPI0035BFA46B
MMPLYRYMDSNPYQRNQTFSFPQYHNPGFGSNPSMVWEPWPYGGNYGYPMPCHSCCNHNLRPSYPHPSMPSPQHLYGGYPVPHPEAYPIPYVPPPPHYSMEIPKYEYDKMVPRNYHCCGCPNHVCQQNIDKGVKIEEQGSDVVDKKADLVPVHMNNNHYPTLWFPPVSMNGREQSKVSEPEAVEETKIPTDSKPPEGLKSQGDQRHIWFPFDLNDIGASMQGGNREPRQEQQVEDKKKEFPFPIFWMPPYQEAGKKEKDVNASRDHKTEDEKKQIPFPFFLFPYGNKQEEVQKEGNREVNSAPKVVPMNSTEGGVTKEAGTNEEKPAGQGAEERKENTANVKNIVVKQMDPHEEEKNSEDEERRERSVPVKQVEENVGNKPSGTSVKRQSSSPKKSSELPPVCLRVDPLPRKKKANGSSRSPSPPAQKGHKKEVEPSIKEKATEVVDRTISENKDPMHASKIPTNSKEDVSRNSTVWESEKDGDRCQTNMDEEAQKVADAKSEETNKPTEATKSVADGKLERTLSDIEAAVLIQSAFRGFEVRRWEPLKKLKQIADIREQVADIRNRISTLETSDLQKDDKQRVIIGETIMRLLLKLDTIQGLLPSLRDIRRSLARELVVLQEKLDEFNTKKFQNPTQEVSTVEHMEELGENTNNSNCMLEQQREDVTGLGEGLPDGVSDSSHNGTDHCQGEVLQNVEPEPGLRAEEPGHCNHRELHAPAEDGDQEQQVESCLKSEDNGSAPIVETKDDVVGEQSNGNMAVGDAEMKNGFTRPGQCSEASSLVEGNHTLTGNSSEAVNINVETREPGELPRGVTDDEPAILEPGKDEQVEVLPNVTPPNACSCVMEKDLEMQELAELSRGMIDEHNALTESTILEPGMIDEHNALNKSTILEPEIVEQVELSPDVPSSNACAYVTEKEAEMQELAELPPGMTDEHNALNESREIEEVGVVKEDDSLQSGGEHHVAFDVTSQPDGTSNTDQLEQRREGAVEEQPIVRLEQQVEIGSQEDEGRPSDSVLDLEVELQPQEQVRKDDHLPLALESIEAQALSLPVQTEAHGVVHEDGPLDIIHDHHSGQPIEDEVPIERGTKDSEHLRAETVIEDIKMQESNLECEDKKNALPNVAETVAQDVFSETLSTPVQKSESLPEKQVAIEASSIDGDVTELESGRKLIEENEKLRAMMQKFMVAGNEQLQAISNLTGRVKDLEKKLARKKKVRGRRLPSRARPSNNRSKDMDAGVAI